MTAIPDPQPYLVPDPRSISRTVGPGECWLLEISENSGEPGMPAWSTRQEVVSKKDEVLRLCRKALVERWRSGSAANFVIRGIFHLEDGYWVPIEYKVQETFGVVADPTALEREEAGS